MEKILYIFNMPVTSIRIMRDLIQPVLKTFDLQFHAETGIIILHNLNGGIKK